MKEQPKNLAQLKLFMAVGQKWMARYVPANRDMGTRELVHKDSVGFGFKQPDGRTSYCRWPKAKDLTFLDSSDGLCRFTVSDDGEVLLAYSLVEN